MCRQICAGIGFVFLIKWHSIIKERTDRATAKAAGAGDGAGAGAEAGPEAIDAESYRDINPAAITSCCKY